MKTSQLLGLVLILAAGLTIWNLLDLMEQMEAVGMEMSLKYILVWLGIALTQLTIGFNEIVEKKIESQAAQPVKYETKKEFHLSKGDKILIVGFTIFVTILGIFVYLIYTWKPY